MSGEDVDKWRKRALSAEAQVQAVRNVCERTRFEYWKLSRGGILVTPPWVDLVLGILDGDA